MWTDKQILDLLQKATDCGADISLTDEQIGGFISLATVPGSDIGSGVMKGISKVINEYGHKPAPCRYKAFEKQFPDNKIEVYLFSNSGNLCGRDYLNYLYVFHGNLYSVPPAGDDFDAVRSGGVKLFSVADCFAALVGARTEQLSMQYELVELDKAASLFDLNIRFPDFLKKYFEKKDAIVDSDLGFRAEIKVV